MRKYLWYAPLSILLLALLFIFSVNTSRAADDGLTLVAPSDCPSTGCAAGQRLNFSLQFSVSQIDSDPNVQVCIYAPEQGQSDGDQPWADFTEGWISDTGLVSGAQYDEGQWDSLCSANLDEGDEYLSGAYTRLTSDSYDQLEFALQIHKAAEIDGYIKIKVLEPNSADAWQVTGGDSTPITVAALAETVYVAGFPSDCDDFQPCFLNSADDLDDGLGTGLRDAIMAVNEGDEILILKDYAIKDRAVLVDKNVNLSGYDNALITFIGSECAQPMLLFTQGGSLSELTINDGNCFSPSRNLVEIDSPEGIAIEKNTLVFGDHAVYVHDQAGDVTVAFNHIVNNDSYAVFRATGNAPGEVNIYANNIISNRSAYQVRCNGRGTANHNYWGEGQSASGNAADCSVSNGKRLGAPIRLATESAGVQSERLRVTTTMSYAFNGQVGAQHSAGEDYDIIIVNHGQGSASNIPFYPQGTDHIQACSNFYDVFLANDAVATNLILALKYDLNSQCIAEIESDAYCGGSDRENYPLLWYDPATSVTDGWDRTGQNPQGSNAGGATGQETVCDFTNKNIRVTIDNTGRPGISNDLNFTPFVIGLPVVDGITLSQFTAQFDGSNVRLQWTTTSEVNIKGFYVLRSDSQDGTYARISNLIPALGDTYIGGIYQYIDTTISFAKTYFYKIEVINKEDQSVGTHGPVSALTATATPSPTLTSTPTNSPTVTPTRTHTPTRTPYFSPTPYYRYRTSTPYYPIRTSTPLTRPTQVRTFGPSPVGTDDFSGVPTNDLEPESAYPPPDSEAPGGWEQTQPVDAYPPPETPIPTEQTSTPEPDLDNEELDEFTPAPGAEDTGDLPSENVRWIFILVGIAGGLSLIGAASVILAGTRFS